MRETAAWGRSWRFESGYFWELEKSFVTICRPVRIPTWSLNHLTLDMQWFSLLTERVGAGNIWLLFRSARHVLWNLSVGLVIPFNHVWMMPLYLGLLLGCSWVHLYAMYQDWRGSGRDFPSQVKPGICHGWRSQVNSLRTTIFATEKVIIPHLLVWSPGRFLHKLCYSCAQSPPTIPDWTMQGAEPVLEQTAELLKVPHEAEGCRRCRYSPHMPRNKEPLKP